MFKYSIDPSDNSKFYHQIIQKASKEILLLDFLNNNYCVALKIIQTYLQKSLNERTELIYFKQIQNIEVSFIS